MKYVRYSKTSRAAALSVEPHVDSWRGRVLAEYRAALDGLTDEEVQRRLNLNPSTERPRRIELVEGGWLRDSGRTRLTASDRKAVVWEYIAVLGAQRRML